jgi:hypothetical protein
MLVKVVSLYPRNLAQQAENITAILDPHRHFTALCATLIDSGKEADSIAVTVIQSPLIESLHVPMKAIVVMGETREQFEARLQEALQDSLIILHRYTQVAYGPCLIGIAIVDR